MITTMNARGPDPAVLLRELTHQDTRPHVQTRATPGQLLVIPKY